MRVLRQVVGDDDSDDGDKRRKEKKKADKLKSESRMSLGSKDENKGSRKTEEKIAEVDDYDDVSCNNRQRDSRLTWFDYFNIFNF